jgi:hypothetical protein
MNAYVFKSICKFIDGGQGRYICAACHQRTHDPSAFIHARTNCKERQSSAGFVVVCSTSPSCEQFGGQLRRKFVALQLGGGVEGPEWLKVRTCNVCCNLGREYKVCGRCKARRFCSRQCQLKDWPTHKKVCKKGQ